MGANWLAVPFVRNRRVVIGVVDTVIDYAGALDE